MKYCVACGNQIEDDAKFCGKCGVEQKKTKNKKPYVFIFIVLFLVLILAAATVIYSVFFRETKENDEKEAVAVSEEYIETEEAKETNAVEELGETEEVILDDIVEEMKEASEITKMVCGAYSKYLDEQDVIQANYFGVENWKYKCVVYPDVNSIKDFEELLGTFYTDNQVADYISILQYVEQDGKLYIAEADGLGGSSVNEYAINISHDTDKLYKIEITAKYVGVEVNEIPEVLNYRLTDKGWRFDQGVVFWGEAPITLYEEEVNKEKAEEENQNVLNSQLKIYSHDEAIKYPGLYLHHTGYRDYKDSTMCTYIRFNEGVLIEREGKKVVSIDVEKDVENPQVKSNMGSYVFIDNSALLVMHDFQDIKRTSIGNIYSVENIYYDSETGTNNYVMGNAYVYTLWDLDGNGASVQASDGTYHSVNCAIMSKIQEGVCIVHYTTETLDGEFKEYYVPVHLTETTDYDTLDTSVRFR